MYSGHSPPNHIPLPSTQKRFLLNKIKTESYSKILINNNYIKSKDISNIEMPIDLNVAYGWIY